MASERPRLDRCACTERANVPRFARWRARACSVRASTYREARVMPQTTRRRSRRTRPADSAMSNGGARKRATGPVIAPEHVELFEHYSECRALGHDWEHLANRVDPFTTPPPTAAYGIVSACRACGTRRIKWLTRSGIIAAPSTYRYSEHYQQRGEGKLDRGDWGRLFIRSHLGGA